MNTKAFTTTWKPIATVFLLLALLITPLSAFAADTAAATVRNTELSGSLADSNTRHYLSVEPSERDGEVTLTLTFGPQDDGRIANKVNFWVLTQSALEDTKDGTVGYQEVALAAGNAISGKSDDYKVRAAFKAAGKQSYTVIVYSEARVAVDYTLQVDNGTLVDDSGQTHGVAVEQMAANTASGTTSDTATAAAANTTETAKNSKQITAPINAQEQLYYTVIPTDNDEDITLNFDYDPKYSTLEGKLNFFVFDSDGLRRLESGERPGSANLAAGNVVKSGESKLSATFRSVGKQSYVVMVINRSDVPATFTLDLNGGDFQ